MDPDIILEMDFLTNNKVKIDVEIMKVEINKTTYKLDNEQEVEMYDEKLEEKIKIIKQSDVEVPESCLKLLDINTNEIYNVGLIPNIEHDITLNGNKVIQMKPFRLPIGIKEKTFSLVENLVRDKINNKVHHNFHLQRFQY
ncbi:hypothetical protein DMUE_3797 [Dictyocoela muelleri]|nr:hypothetical protein DMUE_3797 [Dictyocoela muelleri]